jgi:hypothetical protein
MVIDGIDVVARSTTHNIKVNRHRQVWWVFVWTVETIARCEVEDALESLAERLVLFWTSEEGQTIDDR